MGRHATDRTRFDGFTLRNVTVDGAAQVLNLVGLPSDPIGAVHLDHDTFTNITNPQDSIRNVTTVTRTQVTVNGVWAATAGVSGGRG